MRLGELFPSTCALIFVTLQSKKPVRPLENFECVAPPIARNGGLETAAS